MDCKIYCIEDINNLKYIGSTKQKLNQRFSAHKKKNECSSKLLDLENCEIKVLEICDASHRTLREQYWINNTECINKNNCILDNEKRKKRMRNYRKDNLPRLNEYKKNYREYRKSWGGDERSNNNLLLININLFQ